MFKSTLMRSFCVSLVLLTTHPGGSDANTFTDFVGEMLQGLTGVYERKSLLFFSDFSSNLNRNKIPGRLECDYSDPVKSKMCPPITASPFAHMEPVPKKESITEAFVEESKACFVYTSDAADDSLCVDSGGPRIIQK